MKTTTRHGVFETNSSSTHSISIADNRAVLDSTLPVTKGKVRIFPGEFGWGIETHNDAATKASYCYVYAQEKPSQLQMLREVVEKQMAMKVEFAQGEGYHTMGYIDHQSDEVCAWAFENPELLRRFIFCSDSVLVIDNDNH